MHRDVTNDIDDATSHIDDLTSYIVDVTAHIDAATAHTATVTSHVTPGTIKPSFEPTANVPEKMAKPFNVTKNSLRKRK